MIQLKLALAKSKLFKLVDANIKPMMFDDFKITLDKDTFFRYRNCYVLALTCSESKKFCYSYVFHKSIINLLPEIKTETINISTVDELLALLCNYKAESLEHYRDRLYVLGCCFGYPPESCKIFADECSISHINGLRKDRFPSVHKSFKNLAIISYKNDPHTGRANQDLLNFYADISKYI